MKKKLLTAAIAAAMIAPLAANAAGGPTVYGVAHVAVELIDDEGSTDESTWRVNSRQSILGVKGSEDLGNGLKAVYKMEFQVDLDGQNDDTGYGLQDNGITGGDISNRNTYVGLSGNWGTVLLGKHDDPIKMMTISRDKFNTTLGDWNEVEANTGVDTMEDKGANRQMDAITYISPNFNGFTAVAQTAPGEDQTNDGIDDGFLSIGAKYVNGPIYIGAGWEERDYNNGNDEEESWRIAGSYQFGDFNVGAMYHDTDDVDNNTNIESNTWQLSGSYAFGNNVVKAMWQEGENEISGATDLEYEAWALGLDHNFSKRTRVYAVYTETDEETSGVSDDADAFGVGLVHKF